MFNDIEAVDLAWVEKREALLRDIVSLLSQLDAECADCVGPLMDQIARLPRVAKSLLIKSPAFQKAMRVLTDDTIAAYDDALIDDSARIAGLRSSARALALASAADSSLEDLPRVGWIQLVTGCHSARFVTGSEYGVEIDDDIDISSWLSAIERALGLIARCPHSHSLVHTFVSYIVPLKQREVIQNLSFSSRELPNVIFKNNEASAHLFAETLVHEADHQFFYALEERHAFWVTEPRFHAAAHFSPWRDDSRPLDGILRGLSAFTRVAGYYAAVLPSSPNAVVEHVGPLLVKRVVDCRDAVATLSASSQLSSAGLEYVEELGGALEEAEHCVTGHERYSEWKTDALSSLAAHRRKWRRSRVVDLSRITRDHL
jgi:hypothetical protein